MAIHRLSRKQTQNPLRRLDEARRSAILSQFVRAQDRLVLQASDLSLEIVRRMVDEGAIDVAPTYQRRERWSAAKQSALIESFLLNIPVPPIYLAEDEFGHYSVIDGKQRLTAIRDFIADSLVLTQLETFHPLEGLRFTQLPEELRNALSVRPYIRAVTLLKQSDPELKYEVFTRLNTGGDPLNAQEIRNVAFRGSLNSLVYGLASAQFLRRQLKIIGTKSSAYRNMDDAEYVLRFLTLRQHWQSFSGDLRRSMDEFMRTHREPVKPALDSLQAAFDFALQGCEGLWGPRAFQRPAGAGWRDQALAGMYDAQMVAVDIVGPRVIKRLADRRAEVLAATKSLFDDPQFEEAVREATNTPTRIRYRIGRMSEMLTALAE